MAKVITTELQHSGASGANITLDSSKNVTVENNLTVDGTTTLTGTVTGDNDTKSFRNLIINGAFQIAQRGTSGTTNGYGSVDRFAVWYGGTDEAPTQEQVSLTSGGPFDVGFKKAFKLTNGNQTSAGSDDSIEIQTALEGQDVNNSGWVASDPNSKLTISYWAKSSVAQTFYMRFRAFASSEYEYTYSVALSANTWTKVTKTIPGNSNFSSIVTTNAKGLFHSWALFNGTDQTNNKTLDAWAVKDNANKSPDCTSTWYLTNDATFEITGVQLEVGSTATDFEHIPYADELARCQRYFIQYADGHPWVGRMNGTGNSDGFFNLPVEMRATPTGSESFNTAVCEVGSVSKTVDGMDCAGKGTRAVWARCGITSSATDGYATYMRLTGTTKLMFSAEL